MSLECIHWLLYYTNDDLPCVRARQHVELDLDFKFVDARAPGHISNDFFPVVVAAMRSLEVIREDNVGAVIFLGPAPGHLGTISVSIFVTAVLFETIWRCLEGHCLVEVFKINQVYMRVKVGKAYWRVGSWI